MTSSVLFEVCPSVGRKKIAIATLNRPQVLNGLSLPMCEALAKQLRQWECDDSIALVVLKGAGEKAFCAGGDLHSLYQSLRDNVSGRPWDNSYARNFFAVEYRLDYQIHTYSKPILCWGSGIVMGGGVGLMMGASHRVVTDSTRFAMPEITIGIFPDVGGSWMLGRLPEGIGIFLALTGAQLGAADCRYLGLADYYLASTAWPEVLQALTTASWSGLRDEDTVLLHQLLRTHGPGESLPPGPLQTCHSLIAEQCAGPDFDAVCANIARWQKADEPWLARAAQTFLRGAPGSARLSFALQKAARRMSLASVFQMEYVAVLQASVMGDFKEGIRALLIDKDKNPIWRPETIAGASNEWVQRFFVPPWPESVKHPLAGLGEPAF